MTKHNKITLGLLIIVIVASGLLTLTLASHASNTVSVRDIQLLLALDGYELDPKSIDGKLGEVTKKSIINYRKKKNLPEAANDNKLIDKVLFDSLYEDTNARFFSSPKSGEDQDPAKENSTSEPETGVNSKVMDVYASAIAAIYAARHSTEETKDFYEAFTWILSGVIVAVASLISWGGYTFLRSHVEEIARSTATAVSTAASTNAASNIQQLRNELNAHLAGRTEFRNGMDKFRGDMEGFKDETLRNLEGFLGITTALNTFTYWVIENGRKKPSDRPPIDATVNPIFRTCSEVLELKPTNKTLLGIILANKGIALHLSGKYDAAYKSFEESLGYEKDKPTTLFNIACSSCQLGRYKEAKNYLARAVAIAPETAQQAISDHDFDPIREDKEFKAIVGEKI